MKSIKKTSDISREFLININKQNASKYFFAPLLLVSLLVSVTGFAQQVTGQEQLAIQIDKQGNITYIPDERGNIIPDFSAVGYTQGKRAIPQVPTVVVLHPSSSGNDQHVIQQAIDSVSALPPDKDGLRGAILLAKGIYRIAGTLKINQSGVVLKGEGDKAGGTTIIATGSGRRSLLKISGTGDYNVRQSEAQRVIQNYVPQGAKKLVLADAAGLKVGMDILLCYNMNDRWISALKMDQIDAKTGTVQWQPTDYELKFERRVTAVNGDTISLDNPVMMAIDKLYGAAHIYPFTFEGRIAQVGIEDLRLESEYADEQDENHGWIAVDMDKLENCWVERITAQYFGYAAVSLGYYAKQVTVLDCTSLTPKSIITGGRRYSFNNNGQLNLFKNLYTSHGRHDFVTGAKTLGPNVFTNCRAEYAHADIGPHHRWAVGTLYDQIVTDGQINVQDRGNWGTGHGWAGITQVLWNCEAQGITLQRPWVSGENYSFFSRGALLRGRLEGRPTGYIYQHSKKAPVPSLFELQKLQRRHTGRY
ncbi:hypothetical protein [Sphingobacterium sp. JB170]|uniref:hypothetical protein n=1 Tax=Sphingobacterium sp. JB170 TaxID=1434842 RepID=UPI00097EC1B4|nr:hypothetical protein [Sphingobacterium sp. JB170]SJN46646.1 hypothetical protein FM107_14690 [Sphingobacterium sp. JB170]